MLIKITKSVVHFGFGYRVGFTGDVPDEIGKKLVQLGRAVVLPAVKETEPEVITAVVKKTRKRKVE